MRTLIVVFDLGIAIYIWILLAVAVLFLLTKFKALDVGGRTIKLISVCLDNVTEPLRRPIRKVLPDLGGVDITPIILIVLLVLVRYLIAMYVLPSVS
jgi:YggT family protein